MESGDKIREASGSIGLERVHRKRREGDAGICCGSILTFRGWRWAAEEVTTRETEEQPGGEEGHLR